MIKYFMNFESFSSAPDTSSNLNVFKISMVEATIQDGGSIAITVQYLDNKTLQIIKPGTGESHIIIGDKASSRKDASKMKQELVCNPDMKAVIRAHDLTDLLHHITVDDFLEKLVDKNT
jgi:hypothetical protein